MNLPLPLDAEEIHVAWRITEGGISVTAFTDEAGLPYIGLVPLNWEGLPTGLPIRFQRRRLMVDVVVGFIKRIPIVLFIDAAVTARGLDLRLCLPLSIARRDCPSRLSAVWGSEPPLYRMSISPANSNWPVKPMLREDAP